MKTFQTWVRYKKKEGFVWRCKFRSCHARAYSSLEISELHLKVEHNHPPNESSVAVRKWIGDLKKIISKKPGTVEQIYKDESVNFVRKYPLFAGNLPSFQ